MFTSRRNDICYCLAYLSYLLLEICDVELTNSSNRPIPLYFTLQLVTICRLALFQVNSKPSVRPLLGHLHCYLKNKDAD